MAKNASNIAFNKIYTVTCRDGDLEGRIVGDALDAAARAKQYTSKTATAETKFNFSLDIPDRRDYEIHTLLKQDPRIIWDGEKNVGHWRTREAFYTKAGTDPSYIDECVSKWASGSLDAFRRTLTYAPYPKQYDAISWALAHYAAGARRLLIEAAPRFGKSLVALEVARNLNARTVLILTPFPDADGSFREVVTFHVNYPDAKFEDARLDDEIDMTAAYPGMRVVMASWAFLDDEKESCQSFFEDGVDFIIVDETHRASDTVRSEALLKLIPHKCELHLSGTPYNDKLVGRFTEEETWTYDFIDRIIDAKAARENPNAENAFLASSPEMTLYLIDQMENITEECKRKYPDFAIEENLTLEKFFSDQYLPLVEIFFRNLTTDIADPLATRLMPTMRETMDHILMFVPSCKSADLILKVLQGLQAERGGWNGYHISSVSGIEEHDSFTSVEKHINALQQAHGKTVTISVGKATTGVTLHKLTSIWILRSMGSAEQFVQTILRSGTPSKGKTKTSILCFDSESALVAQAVVARQHARADGMALAAAMRLLYRCLPTFVWNPDMQFQQLDVELALAFTKEIKSRRTSPDAIDIDLVPEGFLSNVKVENKTIAAQIGLGGQKGGKTAQVVGTPKTKAQQKAEADVRMKIIQVIDWLDWVVLLCKVQTVDQLRNITEQDSVGYLKGTKAELLQIIDIVGSAEIQEHLDFFNSKLES